MEYAFGVNTAKFNSNGGSSVSEQTLLRDEVITRPKAPEKSGNIFDDWYTDNDTFLERWNFSIAPNKNITLYAKWSIIEWPSASSLVYGESLSSSELIGGSTDLGTFAWANPETIPVVNNNGYTVIFTPFDNEVGNLEGIELTNCILIEVSPKPITITPDSGQSKVYGTADPVLTYSCSEELLPGNTFTGELSREIGEDAGSYRITLGTLSAGNNYSIVFTQDILFTITRAPGADVYSFFVAGNPEAHTLTVTSVILASATGQGYEYAINEGSGSASSLIWQSGNTFNISINVDYYVYVRSAENLNYETGAVSSGYKININAAAVIIIAIENITSFEPTLELSNPSALVGGIITLSVNGAVKTVDISININDFDAGSVVWEVFGAGSYPAIREENTAVFSLNSANPAYSTLGGHSIMLSVSKDGIPYMINIPFRIVP